MLLIIQKGKLRGLSGTERICFFHFVGSGEQNRTEEPVGATKVYLFKWYILYVIYMCACTHTYMFKDKKKGKENTGGKKKI